MKNNNKIFFSVCLMLALMLLLSACGGVSPTPSGTETPGASASAVPTPEATPEVTPEPTPEPSDKYGLYVDPVNGDDANDGRTLETAVKTIERAQQVARELNDTLEALLARVGKNLTVYLRGGVYYFDETLNFMPEDGGKTGYDVVWTAYKDEKPVFSGGTPITGWTLHDEEKNIYVADAQGIKSRDFFIDGERATRAQYTWMANKFTKTDGGFIMNYKPDFPTSIARPQDLEVHATKTWQYYVLPVVEAIYGENGEFTMMLSTTAWNNSQSTFGASVVEGGNIQHLENAYEFLDEGGEWYLNTDEDKIYYIPKDGQDMSSVHAVLGKLEEIINLAGTEEDEVEHITFSGITFKETTFQRPFEEDGLYLVQAGIIRRHDINDWEPTTAALLGSYTSHITIEKCTFTNIGSSGVYLGRSTKFAKIIKNTFTDCGVNGIMLGGFNDIDHYNNASEVLTSKFNVIEDNYITKISSVYLGGCGITAGYVDSTNIAYNTITELPYTGISVGWGWGYNGREEAGEFLLLPGNNDIHHNYIENVMLRLRDGGGIYTLGRQNGTTITDNYVSGSTDRGIYLDGAKGHIVTHNVVTNCDTNLIYQHSNWMFDNYCSDAPKPDDTTYLTGGKIIEEFYHYMNNQLWDEEIVEEIKNAAGVRE